MGRSSRFLAANSLLVLLLACRDSRDTSGTTGNTASAGGTSATTASSVGDTATGDTESPQGSSTDAGARRSGMTVHLANVRLGGALPTGPDPATDALDVQWDLEIAHFGGEDLVDIRVSDARLVLGNGWSIEFTPESAAFDGRVAAGSTRSIPFHKRPETASPRATHDLCGQWMRLEMVVALGQTGRSSRVQSRSIRVICPDTPTGARPAP